MRLALITGGSHGLGAALCDEYRNRDWSIMEFSRSGTGVHLDLSATHDAVDVFADAFAQVSSFAVEEIVVLNNAAVLGPIGSVLKATPAEIASHFNTNIVSAVLLARSFITTFQERECLKTFVNISSGAAVKGRSGWSLYCASKAAMENFVRAVALEQASRPHPICVFSVNPGVMDTAMQAEIRATSINDFPERERFVGLKLDGRLSQPEIIAKRIADLVASGPEPGTTVKV